jgi:hypothetical protein
MEGQGIIADRTQEHLATSDAGIVKFRKMLFRSIDAVERGEPPLGTVPPNDDVVEFETYKTLGIDDPTQVRRADIGEQLSIKPPYDLNEEAVS